MTEKLKTKDLFDCKNEYIKEIFDSSEYPWEILDKIAEHIKNLWKNEELKKISEGVYAEENVKIYPTATIEPPVFIGAGSVIRPGAYIRGNVFIGREVVVGNSTELKNCILLDKTQVPHYNYVGDSILGNSAHMGAGSICSNLKGNKKEVTIRGDKDYPTKRKKVGAFLGDNAEIGCGVVLNPGCIIGKNSQIYPLVSLRGIVAEDTIVKGEKNIIKKSKE